MMRVEPSPTVQRGWPNRPDKMSATEWLQITWAMESDPLFRHYRQQREQERMERGAA